MASSNVAVDVDHSLYLYNPNKGAPVAFAVMFAATMVAHLIQIRKYKCVRITGPLTWGAIIFVAGFITREVSIYHDRQLQIYIATQVLVIAAPPIYALTNYLILSRTLYYVPYFSPIHPGRVLSTFVGLDVLVEVLTGNGASLVCNSDNKPSQITAGKHLLQASLLLQVGLFVLFISLEITFHTRCFRAGVVSPKLRTIFILLYTSSAVILARNVYRVLETWNVYKNPSFYLSSHEAFFYVFDAALMLCNSVVLNVFHPARYLPASNKVFLAKDGKTEVNGPGWQDCRSWWLSTLDPFDLIGLVTGRDKKSAWWEGEGEWAVKARGISAGDGDADADGGGNRTRTGEKGGATASTTEHVQI